MLNMSKEFYNYTHNRKNLLSNYNCDFKKIVKERVFDKKLDALM